MVECWSLLGVLFIYFNLNMGVFVGIMGLEIIYLFIFG